MKKTKLFLKAEECQCGLPEFYGNVAKAMGVQKIDAIEFDCRKICTSQMVQDAIWKHYTEEGCEDIQISSLLAMCGPKANLTEDGYVVEVEDEFVRSAPHENN